ncbi:cation diffusion facilitator family transporter [Clostridium sp. JN-9]|uniref:cation diffusion facilitator family transporter n=1 Tax=Clostridium sp. JN-9 TaxID=2507159 RepID=UPI000FFE08EE|nr:cation diffusion facilitator family transporter [Clostridium sp. JN-9]QAT39261.1 cation transporter [Clostridium sp. JN-9]
MLAKFIVSKFIKNHEQVDDPKVRDSYGYLGGIVGIILNFILFLTKLIVGIITHSISVTADAFNNLSDTASSLITILGFKLASKPADREHPFGHGRIEYLSGLIVSFMVMLVGFQFLKSSYDRIIHPVKVVFQLIPFVLILISIGVKIWLSRFNNYIGKTIDSSALQASSFDALGDVFTSSSVAASLILSGLTAYPIDGYIGILISLFILYSGFTLIKDTIDPLLGQAPDEKLVKSIADGVTSYDYISGVHDLIVHNYGPGRIMASVHAEVPCDASIIKIHEIIDRAEKEISEKLNIYLVIHMDPIDTNDKDVAIARDEVESIIKKYPMINSFHDFRVVGSGEHKNLVFDIVIDYSQKLSSEFENNIINDISSDIRSIHEYYNAVITIDRDFSSIKK